MKSLKAPYVRKISEQFWMNFMNFVLRSSFYIVYLEHVFVKWPSYERLSFDSLFSEHLMKIYIREKGAMSDFMKFSQVTKEKLNKMIDSDSKKIIGKWDNHLHWTFW